MEKIAFIIGEEFIFWTPVILTVAVLAAAIMFVALHMIHTAKITGAFVTVPIAIALGLVLGRLVYWYCLPDSYDSLRSALTDYSPENCALLGIFAGCVLAACAVRLLGIIEDLPGTLDCMAIAGCLGMAVGRLNHFFNPFDRGMVVETIRQLPLVYPVENAANGEPDYRLATFMVQAIVAAALFVLLLIHFLAGGRKRGGDTFLLFCLGHGASQIVMDSTRYDALYLRSNGFVSMVQIAGAVLVVLAVVLFSVRMVRNRGWKWWYLALWIPIVGLLTAAGIMEYYVQRISIRADFFYHIMTGCLGALAVITVVICCLGIPRKNKKNLREE